MEDKIIKLLRKNRIGEDKAVYLAHELLFLLSVAGRRELLVDFIQWRKQVAVDDLTDKEIVEFYLARKIK